MPKFSKRSQNCLGNVEELRFMAVFSLGIQCILILLGAKRQFWTNIYLRIILWSAYLYADWFATTSVNVLLTIGQNKSDCVEEPEHGIVALWGPLLLLHLGGQDTITAYSMEDNALWSRRLFTYIIQVGIAIFFLIFLRSPTNTDLIILAIPIFIAGFIKIGERIWVLWSASSQQFKESLFPDPDPGPNYARYMEAYNSASFEGYEVDVESLIQTPSTGNAAAVDHTNAHSQGNINTISLPQTEDHYTYGPAVTVRAANRFLKIPKLLFADLILTFQDVSESRSSLLSGNGKRGFEVMEIELGFMYDVFYTKAPIVYSFIGCILRFVTLSCSISVCVFFSIEKNQYARVDVVITNMLLVGAIIFDIYSIISMLFSDWTMLWLTTYKNKVTNDLKEIIFEHFVNKINEEIIGGGDEFEKNNTRFYYNWGNKVLEGSKLMLQIEDRENMGKSEEVVENGRKINYKVASKWLSEYMVYLLVMRPSMLPNGIGEIRFQDTCAEVTEFVRDRRSIQNENQVSQVLHKVCKHIDTVSPSKVKGDRSKSVLFDACRLAQNVREIRNDDAEWETKTMWKFITQVWVEMLAYAASNCKTLYHAQHLRQGGELLTHVWLLMAHLGITDKLHISKGFGRAKLVRK
ncbi:hypothetical protein TSUD_03870 [Trifolium subterraneum]|nr:hypothetical protein TSUD_03870 [Trifolium subterraneum]